MEFMDTDDRLSSPPTRCPYGHPLATGLVSLGWQPCQCQVALVHHGGHTTYTCRICSDRGWTMVYFDPEHLCSTTQATAEREEVRRAQVRLEEIGADPSELAHYRQALARRERMAAARGL